MRGLTRANVDRGTVDLNASLCFDRALAWRQADQRELVALDGRG